VLIAPDGDAAQAFGVIECSLVKHLVVAERSGVQVRARTMLDQALAPGVRVQLAFPPERCLFFDAAGQRLADAR
jgi:multiple sugar transport system ATP-binding protein